MDRLLCGDVGFGKTEVALRAAFKAVQDGKQVAVLVPTTLLAQQHGQTFTSRLAGYPVRVEVLSRFLTPAQAKKVTAGVRDGSVDIVIGTHRLLSADVEFQRPRPARRRRRAALRRAAQGVDQEAQGRRRRAHAVGHADPAHARDEPHRHPRPEHPAHAARRPPADPHLRRRVRRARRVRSHAARTAARGPGVLRPQPRGRHRGEGAGPARARARSAHRHRARSDGRRLAREGRARLRRRRSTTCSCARRSSRAASTCRR